MKKILLLIITLISSTTFSTIKTVGVAGSFSKVHNSKASIRPLPLINLSYNDFFINGSILGYDLYKEPNFKVSLILDPLAGYFNGFSVKGSDIKNYKNINDRESTFMGGLSLSTNLTDTTFMNLKYNWGGEGGKGSLGITKLFIINDRLAILPSLKGNYYEAKYSNYYFGVDEKEASSNSKLKTYNSTDSFSVDANVTVEFNITEQIILTSFLGYEYFSDKISDSPLVGENAQLYYGLGFRYSF